MLICQHQQNSLLPINGLGGILERGENRQACGGLDIDNDGHQTINLDMFQILLADWQWNPLAITLDLQIQICGVEVDTTVPVSPGKGSIIFDLYRWLALCHCSVLRH